MRTSNSSSRRPPKDPKTPHHSNSHNIISLKTPHASQDRDKFSEIPGILYLVMTSKDPKVKRKFRWVKIISKGSKSVNASNGQSLHHFRDGKFFTSFSSDFLLCSPVFIMVHHRNLVTALSSLFKFEVQISNPRNPKLWL